MYEFSEPQIGRKVRRYWVEDGLPDIATGLGFLALAALIWAQGSTDGTAAVILRYLEVAAILASAFLTRFLVKSLKWRVTYPRTGYVSYARSRKVTPWLAGVAIVAGISFAVLAAYVGYMPASAYLVGLSLGMAATFFVVAMHNGWSRGLIYAAIALLAAPLSIGLSSAEPWRTFVQEGGAHFLVVGLSQVVGGAWALRRYLNRYPTPIAVEEERP